MRIAIFGGTGFVGGHLIDALIAAGHEPAVLVRPGSERQLRQAERCFPVAGDIGDDAAIAATLRDCDAAVYLIGILREDSARGITFEAMQYEGACRVIDAARAQGVGRFLLMSANGARADGTPYQRSKYRAEQYLDASGLAGTVLRPSVIFGDPRGGQEFCTRLRDEVVRPPLPAPDFFRGVLPAQGGARVSPVHVGDVAAVFVAVLGSDAAAGRVYPLGGPETLGWAEVIHRIAAACGRSKWVLPVPALPVYAAAALCDRFRWFPITRDQLTMLLEGNTVSDHEAFAQFGIEPRAMTSEALAYLDD